MALSKWVMFALCSACGGVEPCSLWGETRCDGDDTLEECMPKSEGEGEDGKLGWHARDCRTEAGDGATVCVERSEGGAICAVFEFPDPRCNDVVAMACDGNNLVVCDRGFATDLKPCIACVVETECAEQLSVGTYDAACCQGGWGSSCTADSDCVSGLECKVNECL